MRILFITSNRLGDAALSSGALAYLRTIYPDARFTIACGPVAAPLFRWFPALDHLIPIAKRRRGGHWFDLWRACVGVRWDLILDLRRSAIAYCLRARRRIVAAKAEFRPGPGSIRRVEHLARIVGAEAAPAPVLWTDAETDAKAAGLIAEGPPVLAVGPAANWIGKQWRSERFAELIRRLTAPDGPMPDAPVAVLAAGRERDRASPVLSAIPDRRRIDLVGVGDPLLAYACLRRCGFFVGNDSGLMHIAAASGIPTLGLFGPSHPEHYAPWGPNGAYVRTADPYDKLVGGPGYDPNKVGTLMDSLTVDMAEAAARALWTRGGG